jgi:hypothetical protein
MAPPDRKGGSGLSLRTLAIASAGSLTAALVTSRVFPPGTIYASALTPVIVAAVSELLNRPVDRVSELRQQKRAMAREARRLQTARIMGDEPSPLRGAPDFALGDDAPREFATNGVGEQPPPIRIHGRSRPRILHPKVWIATGLAAFAIAAAVLTLPELIFGGSVASSHRTTFFGGGSSSSTRTQTQTTTTTQTKTAPTTVTQTVPAQTQTQTTTTPSQTTTTPDTSTQTTPSGTSTTPTDTGTSTTPAPAAPPAP